MAVSQIYFFRQQKRGEITDNVYQQRRRKIKLMHHFPPLLPALNVFMGRSGQMTKTKTNDQMTSPYDTDLLNFWYFTYQVQPGGELISYPMFSTVIRMTKKKVLIWTIFSIVFYIWIHNIILGYIFTGNY